MSIPFHERITSDTTYLNKVKQIVDKNTNYYLTKWQREDHSAGWNWAAFFLTPFWLSYRYMYGPALIYFLLLVLVWFIQLFFPYVIYYTSIPETSIAIVPAILVVAMSVFFAWKGNALYAKHVENVIDKQERGLTIAPLFNKKGGSYISGILVPAIAVLFLSGPLYFSGAWFHQHSLPNGIFVFDESVGTPTSIYHVMNQDPPVFKKYESSIQLLFHGKATESNEPLQIKLYFRESESMEWMIIHERSYSFFRTNRVTLNLVSPGPQNELGYYLVEVYRGEDIAGSREFEIRM